MHKRAWWALIALLLMPPACAAPNVQHGLLGAWRLDDGAIVTIAPSADGTWRYRQLEDGHSGRLHSVAGGWQAGPGFSDRDPAALVVRMDQDRLEWMPAGSPARQADRVAVLERVIEWQVAGATLRGRLVLPTMPGPHPVAVQLLLGHTKLESTVRYLGIEVDDALEMSEQTEV